MLIEILQKISQEFPCIVECMVSVVKGLILKSSKSVFLDDKQQKLRLT